MALVKMASRPSGKPCLFLFPGIPYHVCVCACVHTHTHTPTMPAHTHTPPTVCAHAHTHAFHMHFISQDKKHLFPSGSKKKCFRYLISVLWETPTSACRWEEADEASVARFRGWSRLPPPAPACSPRGGLPRCWATKWKVRDGRFYPGAQRKAAQPSSGAQARRASQKDPGPGGEGWGPAVGFPAGEGGSAPASGQVGPVAVRPRPQGPALAVTLTPAWRKTRLGPQVCGGWRQQQQLCAALLRSQGLCPPIPDLLARGLPPLSLLGNPSLHTMKLDIQCEQLSDARWTELLPLIQQYEVVRLDDCGLTEVRCKDIGSALQANASLTELSLRTNELGDGGVLLVLQGLQSPTCKIQKLSLQNCCLTEAGCGVLPGVLRSLPTLRELHLSDNPLGDAGLRLLCEGLLDPQCRLEKLQLEYCNLTAASCEPLAAVLRATRDLKELVVSNNDIGEAGVQALCRGLAESACQLETLKLENCGLMAANCKDLCGIVASQASLKDLDLGSNRLGDAGLAELCPGLLSPSSQLRTLWLWECDLTVSGCRDLCRILQAKESLKELSLAGNSLGDEGAQLLCESLLQPGCQLESLWVKSCGFTAACCQHFGSVLTQNKHLLELQLSSNPLGDAGVHVLCQALGQPGTVLRVLWVGDCELTNSSCGSLAALLLASPSLRELDLSNNGLGDPGVLQLLGSLEQPACSLEQLVLYDIYWTEAVDERLRAVEESKPGLRIIS